MKWGLLLIGFWAALFLLAPSKSHATASSDGTPHLKALNDDRGPIPATIINDMFESCKYHIPEMFTPRAREYYCACNSAAVQGNFLMPEYRILQRKSNQNPKNKIYEKYITTAVAPCMDLPSEQMAYVECLVTSASDIRIGKPLPYCRCIARKVRKYVEDFGAGDMITRMITYPERFQDPTYALFDNKGYNTALSKAQDLCLSNPNDRTGE